MKEKEDKNKWKKGLRYKNIQRQRLKNEIENGTLYEKLSDLNKSK
jgi:hypothetical protein